MFPRSFGFSPLVLLAFFLPAWAARAEPFKLFDPGAERVVDYEKYGEFKNAGAFDYRYVMKDRQGLAKASGEGIDPNQILWQDPMFKEYKAKGKLTKSPWNYVRSGDSQADFFAWAASSEDPGLRLLFTGKALEEAGHYEHALKAYRAAMILFPKSFCWSRKRNYTWLVAPTAWGSIIHLTQSRPELDLKLVDALVKVRANVGGDPMRNDVAVTPGRFIKYTPQDRERSRTDLSRLKVVSRRGGKKVACVKYDNGQWGLEADGKPFFVQGISYLPTKVDFHPKDWNWMDADENKNGKNDVAYETWVDKNKNGVQDPDEPIVGDFKLLQEMGCNAIRIFTNHPLNLPLLREMRRNFGIYGVLNEFLGAYTVHSGATWEQGTDYRDPQQRKQMLEAVRNMVEQCKGEPWLLAYVLGNENNMPANFSGVNASRTNAAVYPEAYASLLNEAAALIHKLDPDHPVGVGNMGLNLLDVYAEKAPELDFIGVNEYAGKEGFGALWEAARAIFDRPVLIMEFGCDAYRTGKGFDEEDQAEYDRNNWQDIAYNRVGGPGTGTSIGGMLFEWLDEWWKDTSVKGRDGFHDTDPTIEMAFPDGWSQEEWLGIAGQGNGRSSPFLREFRKTYEIFRELWNAKPEH